MATVQEQQSQQKQSTGHRLVLDNVSWTKYIQLRRAFGDRRIRLTYDRGTLEIMTLSPERERLKCLLGRLIETLTEELSLKSVSFGSMTCRRRHRKRGLEPDECFYIASQPLVRGRDRVDLRRDPPPDLALEIDISHSSLDRLSIYAAIGVPEIWRYENESIVFHFLGTDGYYSPATKSGTFNGLTSEDFSNFLALRFQLDDDNEIVRRFRTWIRQNLAGGTTPPTSGPTQSLP